MATPLRLFVDVQARRLVLSGASASAAPGILLRQGENLPIQVYLLDSTGGNPTTNPFPGFYSSPGLTLQMGVCADLPTGGSESLIAFQDTWTSIQNGFAGFLNLNTEAMGNALANRATRGGTLELQVTEAATGPVKLIQQAVTLQAAVINGAGVLPVPLPDYLTRVETEAAFVKHIGAPGASMILVSSDGSKAVEIKCGDDGSLITASIDPWEDPS